jgi:hypothetical protein
MTTTMTSAANTCPRCNGSGKVSYRPSNGLCYRCNGIGLIGHSNPEADMVIRSYRAAVVAKNPPVFSAPEPDDGGAWLLSLFSK